MPSYGSVELKLMSFCRDKGSLAQPSHRCAAPDRLHLVASTCKQLMAMSLRCFILTAPSLRQVLKASRARGDVRVVIVQAADRPVMIGLAADSGAVFWLGSGHSTHSSGTALHVLVAESRNNLQCMQGAASPPSCGA